MTINPQPPIFGTCYDVGWVGFSRDNDVIGNAIAYGERWEEGQYPSVNHAFIVVGDNLMVEALLKEGVVRDEITTRTLDPAQKVYFMKPIGWTPELGAAIAATAATLIGSKYDDILIAENALADTLLGHAVNSIFHDWPHDFLDKIISELTPHEFICSYATAFCLASQPAFKGCPLFEQQLSSIDPQLLMVKGPFEPFINQVV